MGNDGYRNVYRSKCHWRRMVRESLERLKGVYNLTMIYPVMLRRGIFITGASILGAGVRAPRITTKNLIRSVLNRSMVLRISC